MKISTLIIALTISLGVAATSYAKSDTKLCIYTACKVDRDDYICAKINNGFHLRPFLAFTKLSNGEYGVANYTRADCYNDGKNICDLRIPKGSPCDLSS